MKADHWLDYVVAEGVVVSHIHVRGDWGVQMAGAEGTYFHFVVQGGICFAVDGMEEVQLEPGDIIVLPHGDAHKLKRFSDSETVSLGQFLKRADGVRNKSSDATSVVCGSFGIDRNMCLPALKALPKSLHLKADSGVPSVISETLNQLRVEVENIKLGSQMVIRHLLSTLFIYVLREWSENGTAEAGSWFSAMQSRHIARALACIHEKPDQNWSLERLAQEAGLSRSAFARQFRESVGETPHSYLTRWRLGIASQLLTQTNLSIDAIAIKVGYTSEHSFSRAFKAVRGITPTKEREKQHHLLPRLSGPR